MKIKALIIALLLSTSALASVHGLGLGIQFNYSTGGFYAPGAALAVSPIDALNIAGTWYVYNETNIIGLTVDFVPLTIPIIGSKDASSLNFNLGAGIFTNMHVIDKKVYPTGGVRFPVGLNFLLMNNFLEIYANVAPSFGVDLATIQDGEFKFSQPFYPIAVGARIWLR